MLLWEVRLPALVVSLRPAEALETLEVCGGRSNTLMRYPRESLASRCGAWLRTLVGRVYVAGYERKHFARAKALAESARLECIVKYSLSTAWPARPRREWDSIVVVVILPVVGQLSLCSSRESLLEAF